MSRRELLAVGMLLAGALWLRARIADGWVFAGADSYGYVHLADELRLHHRLALGPPPEPLHYGRVPGYPIFIALVKGSAPAEKWGGDGWRRIEAGQRWVEVLVAL